MFDTESFVNEVRVRPPLWNIKLKEYSNRDLKGKLWIEVAEAVVPDWDELETVQKNNEVKELQKKWKSLKDGFAREIRLQKMPSGSGKKTRKRYIYFEQLLFLSGNTEMKETTTNLEEDVSMSQGTAAIEEDAAATTPQQLIDNTSVGRIAEVRRKTPRPAKSFEAKILEHIQSRKTEPPATEDADRLFLLSLLPLLHACPLEAKLWARIKMQEVLQQALQFRNLPQPQPLQHFYSSNSSASYPHTSNSGIQVPVSRQDFNIISSNLGFPSQVVTTPTHPISRSANNLSRYTSLGTQEVCPSSSTPAPLMSPASSQNSDAFTYQTLNSPTMSDTMSDIYSVYGDQ